MLGWLENNDKKKSAHAQYRWLLWELFSMCLIECADVEPAAMETQLFFNIKRTAIWQSEINSLSGHLFWQQFEGRISCSEAGEVEGQLEGSRGHLHKGLGSEPWPWEWKGSHRGKQGGLHGSWTHQKVDGKPKAVGLEKGNQERV